MKHCRPSCIIVLFIVLRQQIALMDGYKIGANHAISGHVYDNNWNKDSHACSEYQAGYSRGWDKFIWATEHTCYQCVKM